MSDWLERFTSPEDVNLFNSAFLAAIIHHCAVAFHDEAVTHYEDEGIYMPLSLAFVVVPGVMSRQIRESFPKVKTTSLTVWLESNEKHKKILQRNASALTTACRRSILIGTQMGLFSLRQARFIPSAEANKKELNRLIRGSKEIQDIFKVAERFGKSFARSGDARTIFSLWGLSVT